MGEIKVGDVFKELNSFYVVEDVYGTGAECTTNCMKFTDGKCAGTVFKKGAALFNTIHVLNILNPPSRDNLTRAIDLIKEVRLVIKDRNDVGRFVRASDMIEALENTLLDAYTVQS